jgi:hypothetical protein
MRYFHDVNSIIKKILKALIWYKVFKRILTFVTLNRGRTVFFNGRKPGQVFFSTFIGITFERNELFSWCKFHNKEEESKGRTVFFNGGNDDNLYQNICFDHV